MSDGPADYLISVVHPSARPAIWWKTRDAWLEHADRPDLVDYVVAFDEGTESPVDPAPARVAINTGRHTSVDATNAGAAAAKGELAVVISDDIWPCPHWDTELRKVADPSKEQVIKVRVGGQADERDLFAVQILTQKRYAKLGYLFYPEYLSMYADDEFGEHARRDGVVVDANHLLFEHRHFTMGANGMDEVYARQNGSQRYTLGNRILKMRRKAGFPGPDKEIWVGNQT